VAPGRANVGCGHSACRKIRTVLVQNMGRGAIALLIGYPLLLAAGQILFKRTAARLVGLPMPEQLLALLVQPSFYTACLLYAAATVLWVWLLTYIPLSAAYPFVALSFVVVPIASALNQTEVTGRRSSLAIMASADWVQTNGFGLSLCSAR